MAAVISDAALATAPRTAIFGRGEEGLDDPAAGIGLYLVDTLLSAYGGDVWVEDIEPTGAVFVIALPKPAGSS